MKVLDEIKSIKDEAEKLDEQGVNIIVAVGHSGFVKDKEIAKEVSLVDVVVGGHSNTFLYNGIKPSNDEIMGKLIIHIGIKSFSLTYSCDLVNLFFKSYA